MDFQRRSVASPTSHHVSPQGVSAAAQPPVEPPAPKKGHMMLSDDTPKWLRIISVILLFSLTVVVLGVLGMIHYGTVNENKLVNSSKFQAVFLTNDQVYFGKVKAINSKYIDLQDIFYLNNQSSQGTSSTSSSSNTSLQLVKLGCEVHGPYDEMIINTDQVTFWENLQDTSQVVKAIGTWNQQNPNGQTCSSSNSTNSTTQSTGSSSSSTSTGSSSSSTSTTK